MKPVQRIRPYIGGGFVQIKHVMIMYRLYRHLCEMFRSIEAAKCGLNDFVTSRLDNCNLPLFNELGSLTQIGKQTSNITGAKLHSKNLYFRPVPTLGQRSLDILCWLIIGSQTFGHIILAHNRQPTIGS